MKSHNLWPQKSFLTLAASSSAIVRLKSTNAVFNMILKSVNVNVYIHCGEENVYSKLAPVSIDKIIGPIYTLIILKLSDVFFTTFFHFMILFGCN
jgi:hypothetical protein